jgi:DNA-binding ferritin-like protein (Dps family)
MNFWDKITGNDMNRDWKTLEARAKKLPEDYKLAWKEFNANLWLYTDFTGRKLMPIIEGVLSLLEEAAADSQSVEKVLGKDIGVFCSAVASEEGLKSFRDKWRDQLNKNVIKKLGSQEEK